MSNNLQQLNKNNRFAIIANFTRSFDISHKDDNRIHLISSLCLITETEMLYMNKFLGAYSSSGENEMLYVFIIKENQDEFKNKDIIYKEDLVIIQLTINEFISHLGFTDKSDQLFENVFGKLNLDSKNFDVISQQSIFIFPNQMWSNILLSFKINNVDISGGSTPKRHILQTVDFQLVLQLLRIFGDTKVLKNIIYNSFRDPILSSSVPLNYYKQFLDYKDDFYNLKVKDIKNISTIIKDSLKDNERKLFNYVKFDEIIINNFTSALEMLILDITMSIKYDLDKMNNVNRVYESELNSLNFKMSSIENIDNVKTRYLSNKEKKRFKKERTLIKASNVSGTLANLRYEISGLERKIELLSKDILSKESELNRFEENSKEYTLLDLNNLHKKYLSVNTNRTLLKKTNTKQVNNTNNLNYYNSIGLVKYGIRHYHSLNHRDFSSNNTIKKFNFYIDSPIYIELKRILNNSNCDSETQLKIEQFLQNQGVLLLKNRIDQSLDINYYKLNPYVLDYLKKSITELEKLINNYKTNINAINNKGMTEKVESLIVLGLSNDDLISQILGRFLRIISNNHLSQKNNCTDLACDLGQSLIYQFYVNKYKESTTKINDYSLSQFVDDNYKSLNETVTDSVLIQIGLKLLNFLEEVNLIHNELYTLDIDHKIHIFVCNEDIYKNISKFINLYNLSYKIPMIAKPKEYGRNLSTGKDILGGYFLNDKENITPIIIKNNELKNQSVIDDKNIIFDLVNRLSSVAYKINTSVLDFILDKGVEYELFTDPNFIHPLELKEKKLTLLEKKKLESFLSKKQLEMNILGLALIYKNVDKFYIPVRIDNRGRVYCMSDYLNYQGIELAKALLLFSTGELISVFDLESIKYLKLFGANCFGNGLEKKSYRDRVDWVDNNIDDILNFRNGKLIMKAESKLLFIAFCFEYLNYHNSSLRNESYYTSYFPIQLDATCNGYQHLSLLTGDDSLAYQLNLIGSDENKDSTPKDFYSFVALKLNDYLKRNLIEAEKKNMDQPLLINQKELDTIESYKRLLKIDITRKLVKLPIMVKPYNASLFQMVNYIKEQFELVFVKDTKLYDSNLLNEISDYNFNEDENKNKVYFIDKNKQIKLNYKDLYLFSNLIEEVVYTEFPKLKELNTYLNRVAEICCKLNITITWVLPTGLNVNQYYVDSEAIRLKPFRFKKNTLSLKIRKENINKAKQIRALMPNLIHSLDAASLTLIVDMFFKKNESKLFNFFAIHDCFAVTANNISTLINNIKLVYIKIYSDDSYLKRFDQGIIDSIKLHFGNEAFNDETKQIKVNGFNIVYPNVDEIIQGKIEAHSLLKANFIVN